MPDAEPPMLTLRPALEAEADLVADIVYGDPQQETTRVGLAAFGLVDGVRTRRFFHALWSALDNWRHTRFVEEDGRPIGVLQVYAEGREPASIGLGFVLRVAWILGPWRIPRLLSGSRFHESVSTERPEGSYHIEELHIAPAERGRGLGGSVLALADAEARERGAPRMSLQTLTTNPARFLYERAGFTVVDTATDREFERLTGCEGNQLMVKNLG